MFFQSCLKMCVSYNETFDKYFHNMLQFVYQRYYDDRVPENREY
jgi:hypothetical protein